MDAEFTRQGIPFFNRDNYDLFYMGYGDTVPSTGWRPGSGPSATRGGRSRQPTRRPRLGTSASTEGRRVAA
jgi:hypothetical protein